MTARGPARSTWNAATDVRIPWEYDRDIGDIGDDDNVPYSFTEECQPMDGDDYTGPYYDTTPRTVRCDQRYSELAGRINFIAAELDELKRTIEGWTGDS